MLLRVLLEAVGTSARAVGPRFATAGRLLRTVLLPTLERLGARAGKSYAEERQPPKALMSAS